MRLTLSAIALSLVVSGCAMLPSAGPSASAVVDSAVSDDSTDARYVLVEVTQDVARAVSGRAQDATLAGFGDYRGAVDQRIGVGDVVTITIWEAGSGGLFSAAPIGLERGQPGSRAASIPEQTVGRDGAVTVPYAGRVRAAGRTTADIQREIERALEGKAIQPQVLVTVVRPVANTVTVLGEAAGGGRVPLSPKGDRVLDVIATAGGSRAPVNESFVQLSRGSRTARVSLTRVVSDPRENIFVRPGDVLTIVRDPQTFLAHGATGRNAEVPFEGDSLTLAQALTKAGGLLDYRADPNGVFLFRFEPERVVRRFAEIPPGARVGDRVKVVYHFKMRDADTMFLASQFRVFNRDLLYVSNAFLSDAQKVTTLFNTIASPVATTANVANKF